MTYHCRGIDRHLRLITKTTPAFRVFISSCPITASLSSHRTTSPLPKMLSCACHSRRFRLKRHHSSLPKHRTRVKTTSAYYLARYHSLLLVFAKCQSRTHHEPDASRLSQARRQLTTTVNDDIGLSHRRDPILHRQCATPRSVRQDALAKCLLRAQHPPDTERAS
jgi:hypothetical protein